MIQPRHHVDHALVEDCHRHAARLGQYFPREFRITLVLARETPALTVDDDSAELGDFRHQPGTVAGANQTMTLVARHVRHHGAKFEPPADRFAGIALHSDIINTGHFGDVLRNHRRVGTEAVAGENHAPRADALIAVAAGAYADDGSRGIGDEAGTWGAVGAGDVVHSHDRATQRRDQWRAGAARAVVQTQRGEAEATGIGVQLQRNTEFLLEDGDDLTRAGA